MNEVKKKKKINSIKLQMKHKLYGILAWEVLCMFGAEMDVSNLMNIFMDFQEGKVLKTCGDLCEVESWYIWIGYKCLDSVQKINTEATPTRGVWMTWICPTSINVLRVLEVHMHSKGKSTRALTWGLVQTSMHCICPYSAAEAGE